jgi:murein peptide amidase A
MNNPEVEQPFSTPPINPGVASLADLNDAYQRAVAEQQRHLPEEEAAYRQLAQVRSAYQQAPPQPQLAVHEPAEAFVELSDFLKRTVFRLKHGLGRHKRIVLSGAVFALAIVVYLIVSVILVPQTVRFSFSKLQNCAVSPAFFPSLLDYHTPAAFSVSRSSTISVEKVVIFSSRVCVSPQIGPNSKANYRERQTFRLLGLHISKNLSIATGSYPAVSAINLPSAKAQALPLIQPLQFQLTAADDTFSYAISANNKTTVCTKSNQRLSCNLTPLGLSYGAPYRVSVARQFHQLTVPGSALSLNIQTIIAAGVTQTSIAANTTVYDIPQQITLQTNKPLTHVQGVSLTYQDNGKTVDVPITSSFKGATITITVTKPLPRQTAFNLQIANVTANDQSQFEQAYSLPFTTSGGPAVTANNLPSYGVASGQTITLTFSQALLTSQNASSVVSLQANNMPIAATYSLSGNQIIIQPTADYPVCANITIQLNNTLQSNYGISGNSAYSFTTRSHCYTTFSIGNSVQGRPITGYKFGSGSSMVLYIGAMEGNEQNSSKLLAQWIPDVDANPNKIPSYRTIVIIPTINPDGYAADTRLNADGIDLNRNFPANNWQEQVTEPLGNGAWTNDGGPNPLSEPESQALANYFLANRPRLTLTEHSHGGIVEANDAADSIALGQQYAELADYKAIPTYEIGNFFDYTTTGAFEDWVNDKIGLPVLEVELESATNDEYSRNLPALWAMAQVSQ